MILIMPCDGIAALARPSSYLTSQQFFDQFVAPSAADPVYENVRI
jgi:hypothetical protein